MPSPVLLTPRDHIAWSYANLARAHAALADGRIKYIRTDHMIRAKLFKGLCNGSMSIGSIYGDERLKYKQANACVYCGNTSALSVDHLIPRSIGGVDDGANLVVACRTCNSSKNSRDLIDWYERRNTFPPLMVLRRYTKLVTIFYSKKDMLDVKLSSVPADFPIQVTRLPLSFPSLAELRL